jgi:IS5 family transposase
MPLAALRSTADAELSAEQRDAVGLLALVAGQDVEPGESEGTWRIAERVAPDRVISTVDSEARHMHKSVSSYRDGYKAHIAVEPETGILTAAVLTAANAPDGPTGVELLAGEPAGLQVLGDSAYGSGATRAALRAAEHTQAIKAIPLRRAVPDGFDRDDFIVDHAARTLTCPAGRTVAITAKGSASFGPRCRGCPLSPRCTTSKSGRTMHVAIHDAEMVEARRAWREGDFAADYRRWRPMVERSIAWLVADRNRRVRFRDVARNRLGLSNRVAAINLRRLVNMGLDHDGGWILRAAPTG